MRMDADSYRNSFGRRTAARNRVSTDDARVSSRHETAHARRAPRAARQGASPRPVVIVGQHGLTAPVLHEIDLALAKHELVKVRVLSDDRDAREAMLAQRLRRARLRAGPAPGQGAGPLAPESGEGKKADGRAGSADEAAQRPLHARPHEEGRPAHAGRPGARAPAHRAGRRGVTARASPRKGRDDAQPRAPRAAGRTSTRAPAPAETPRQLRRARSMPSTDTAPGHERRTCSISAQAATHARPLVTMEPAAIAAPEAQRRRAAAVARGESRSRALSASAVADDRIS